MAESHITPKQQFRTTNICDLIVLGDQGSGYSLTGGFISLMRIVSGAGESFGLAVSGAAESTLRFTDLVVGIFQTFTT